jgi:hypothetical protein
MESKKDQALIGFLALAVVTLIFAWPFQWLWNNVLMDAVDFVKILSYWQSFGMLTFIYIISIFFNLKAKK